MQRFKKQSALVTVVIPAYNADAYISQTLESVEKQTYPDLEVLVVDDGSTDRTAEIVQEFAERDARFRLIQQPNAGVGAARNRGIREACGEFIAPLDADDVWHPEKLQLQVNCMVDAGPDVGLVYCWSNRVNAGGELIGKTSQVVEEGWISERLMLRNFIGCASVPLIRKTVFDRVGHYLTRAEQGHGQGCEDRDLYLRVTEVFQVRVVREYLVDYRQLKMAMSLNAFKMMKSFELVLTRARARNPHYPAELFRWARSNFYRWLMRKSFLWQMDSWAVVCLRKAVIVDPWFLLSKEGYAIAARCILRSCSPKPAPEEPLRRSAAWDGTLTPVPRTGSANEAFFGQEEARRWESAGSLQVGERHPQLCPDPRHEV